MAICLLAGQAHNVMGQVTPLTEASSNAETAAHFAQSNAEAKVKADTEYLRLHPEEVTNALTKRQLELLDIAGDRVAQSNYFSQYHTAQELQELTNTVRLFLTNVAAQSSYFYYKHGGMTESEYRSNIVSHMQKPMPWPDTPNKWSTLKFCADTLRSALDTNRLAAAFVEMTNQPNATLSIMHISNVVISNLTEFAAYLTNPRLNVYDNVGDIASTRTNEGKITFIFWSTNGPVRELDKRTVDGRLIFGARFDESGKLLRFSERSPDSNGVWATRNELVFNADGTLHSFLPRPKVTTP